MAASHVSWHSDTNAVQQTTQLNTTEWILCYANYVRHLCPTQSPHNPVGFPRSASFVLMQRYDLICLVFLMVLCLRCGRSVGRREQCWHRFAFCPCRLAHHRGLQAHAGRQPVWRHRRDTERPPSHQEVQRPSGERRQRVRPSQPRQRSLLHIQVRSGGLQRQSAVRRQAIFSYSLHIFASIHQLHL